MNLFFYLKTLLVGADQGNMKAESRKILICWNNKKKDKKISEILSQHTSILVSSIWKIGTEIK